MKGNCSWCEKEIDHIEGRRGRNVFCNKKCRDRFYSKYYNELYRPEEKKAIEPEYYSDTSPPKQCSKLTDSCLNCPLPVCIEEKKVGRHKQMSRQSKFTLLEVEFR
jgi:hypothetical protein